MKVTRRSFFLARSRFPSWRRCTSGSRNNTARGESTQRGHRETIEERFERERDTPCYLRDNAIVTKFSSPSTSSWRSFSDSGMNMKNGGALL